MASINQDMEDVIKEPDHSDKMSKSQEEDDDKIDENEVAEGERHIEVEPRPQPTGEDDGFTPSSPEPGKATADSIDPQTEQSKEENDQQDNNPEDPEVLENEEECKSEDLEENDNQDESPDENDPNEGEAENKSSKNDHMSESQDHEIEENSENFENEDPNIHNQVIPEKNEEFAESVEQPLTYDDLLAQNQRFREQLEEKTIKVHKLEEENIELKDNSNRRTNEFVRMKSEHTQLIAEVDKIKSSSMNDATKPSDAEGKENPDEKLIKLKKKVLQEKKKNERLEQEKVAIKENYTAKIEMLEEKLNSQVVEFTSQFNQLQAQKRKMELELDNLSIEHEKLKESHHPEELGDNKAAHMEMMKKDMGKLIEFKNELEALIEQQNVELGKKDDEIKAYLKELKGKDNQIKHMNEYISELEKANKNGEYKVHQVEVKVKKLKQSQIVELTKKVRDQKNQIDILKEMVNSNK